MKRYFLLSTIILIYFSLVDFAIGARLFVNWPGQEKENVNELQSVSKYLGLDLVYEDPIFQRKAIKNSGSPSALLVNASSLRLWSSEKIYRLVREIKKGNIFLMVVFDREIEIRLIGGGSNDVITSLGRKSVKCNLIFAGDKPELLGALSDSVIPTQTPGDYYFLQAKGHVADTLASLIWIQSDSALKRSVMMVQDLGKGKIFYLSLNELSINHKYYKKIPILLPYIIFNKNIFGEKCWHRNNNQANFIIDDPWLIEPYGNLSYYDLLKEMNNVNFHTTIAFIPWNFDRNKRNVIDLFRNHENRYSIVFHGNNHDRYEFRDLTDVPIDEQERNIRQAILRMDIFGKNIGLGYDNIMVFPHGISPMETISILRKYHFLASVNSDVVPKGSSLPDMYDYILWPAVLNYHSFPLLLRHPTDVENYILNIDSYLMKPLILYTHQDFFANGINSFNEKAKYINIKNNRNVHWTNLGEIAKNLYMERLTENGRYDILLFSTHVIICNGKGTPKKYRIVKDAILKHSYDFVRVGEKSYLENNKEDISFELKTGERKEIRVEYKKWQRNEWQSNMALGVGKKKDKTWIIRMLSDFRDIELSRSWIGRKIIKIFHDYIFTSPIQKPAYDH